MVMIKQLKVHIRDEQIYQQSLEKSLVLSQIPVSRYIEFFNMTQVAPCYQLSWILSKLFILALDQNQG